MEAPEYLDLDEIDFTDDLVYSVTSLKSIPELCRRNESQNEERQVPAINWSRGVSSHGGNGIKPAGIAEVHSKFRPVKRVSPLKHQPEVPDSGSDAKSEPQNGDGSKAEPTDKPSDASQPSTEGQGFKGKSGGGGGAVFGELEHYDLDMDEILDVPYIKSNQHIATLPRTAPEKRSMGGGPPGERGLGGKASGPPHTESLGGVMPYCALSPVKWPDLRKSKSMDPDFLRQPVLGGLEHSPRGCPRSSEGEGLPSRTFGDTRAHKAAGEVSGSQSMSFALQGCSGVRGEAGRGWGGPTRAYGEMDEETKKVQNIINTIRGGQISLLPHLAADNLELIRDEDGNNLLHISAAHGHADCLQHLTSLMGEDCLNERNSEQLTPAGLGIKNGHLECVRWMVSETEAIAELSCSRDHPSLIHYAARFGQEKILLWLLQFMQEQAISLDEVDQSGNSAVHVAAQHGHLSCIQTLVEYGSNVTIQNQQGERPSQSAERHGHTTCSRYLVVVETCMSLASQVVKLTKQLNEQTAAKMTLQSQFQQLLLDSPQADGSSIPPPSGPAPHMEAWPEMTLTAEAAPGDGHWVLRQRDVDSDTVLRQLLGKEIAEKVCTKERLSLEFRQGGGGPGADPGTLRRMGVVERRELKLARLKQIMQRSLSESDSDAYPPEGSRSQASAHTSAPTHGPAPGHNPAHGPAPVAARPERPRQLPIAESEDSTPGPHLPTRRHTSAAERKFAFAHGASKSADGYNPSPTSDGSDPDHEPRSDTAGDGPDGPGSGKSNTTSPKSALKSPSSRRKTSQNLKLRVTFDEQVVHKGAAENEARAGAPAKDSEKGGARTQAGSESGEAWKRPFGTFRSIMESLSGNQNSNNNNPHVSAATKCPNSSTSLPSPGRKLLDTKAGQTSISKSKSKTSAV